MKNIFFQQLSFGLVCLMCLLTQQLYGQYRELRLVLQHTEHPERKVLFVPGDLISLRTSAGNRNIHRKIMEEVLDSSVVVEGADTVWFSRITSLTDKSLGASYYRIGGKMCIAACLSAGLSVLFYYVGSANVFYVGQLLTLSFAVFSFPFGLVNLLIGKVKNMRHFNTVGEWKLFSEPFPVNVSDQR